MFHCEPDPVTVTVPFPDELDPISPLPLLFRVLPPLTIIVPVAAIPTFDIEELLKELPVVNVIAPAGAVSIVTARPMADKGVSIFRMCLYSPYPLDVLN